ncbi:MAG: hypothetical protein E6422_02715 [Veillonella sp.]|uniref:hypothetical protein n=1 Tax=Veillonella sp. TaxID=1926307 RepID=UPI0029065E05|nr:hypothetical protein [Veillonella sp.]MDU6787060.1 hypothetical protein [Veillonella sp.]
MEKKLITGKISIDSDLFRNNIKELIIETLNELLFKQDVDNMKFTNKYNAIKVNENKESNYIDLLAEKNIEVNDIKNKGFFNEISNSNQEITELKTERDNLKQQYKLIEDKYFEYKKLKDIEINNLKNDKKELLNEISDINQKLIDFKNQRDRLNEQYKEKEEEFSKYKILQEKEVFKVKEANKSLIEKYNIDKNELISKISDLNDELDNIFKKSRELYSNIKELDSIYIKELGKPINLDDFETFIISSVTNGKSLSNIWSVAKMAINNGDEVSFNILWQYFKEMISLHNKAKGEDVFTIDNVQIGDTYSVHDHESKNENISYGHVSKIYILGFTNSFIGKRVEKSYVLIEE